MRVFLVCGGNMVPKVNIKQPYVYLDFLRETDPKIWDEAQKQVSKFNQQELQGGAQKRLQDTIFFLQNVAVQQRAGEIAFIQDKIRDLEAREDTDTQQIRHLKARAGTIISRIKNDEGFDYIEFTNLMNEVIIGKENLRGRLITLENNIKNINKHNNQSTGYLENIGKELQNLIQRLNNEKQNIDKRQTSYENIMPTIIYEYIMKNQKKLKELTTQELYAWAEGLTIEFRSYLERQGPFRRNLNKLGYTTFEERKEYLESQFNSFLKVSENDELDFSDEKIKELKEIKELLFTNIDSPKEKITRKFYNIKNPITQEESFPEVIFKFDLSDYAVSEKVGQIFFRIGDKLQATGAANMADDALIGKLVAEFPQTLDKNNTKEKIDITLKELANAADVFAKARTDREQYFNNLQIMNKKIEAVLDKLNKELKEDGTKGFIIHESDKYYKTIEHGKKGFRGEGFHGRTLPILNYIDTMRSIQYDFGIGDPNLWYFIGINLANHSVAHSQISALEKVFTMAAGLIMFDDFATIAKEGMGQLQFSNIYNIHLYKLQSLYFPASYIIQETANYLAGISAENPAVAKISVPNNIFAINRYSDLNKLYKETEATKKQREQYSNATEEKQWEIVKDYMATETKVSINFFLNFQNFISQIPH